jgi:hypothetical protein
MKESRRLNASRCRAALALILIAALAILAAGCNKGSENEKGAPVMSTDDAIRVMDAHVKELMAIPGVVGVAVGALDDGKPCIQVLVAKETPELRALVPNKLEGYAIVIEVTGEIRPMPGDSAR